MELREKTMQSLDSKDHLRQLKLLLERMLPLPLISELAQAVPPLPEFTRPNCKTRMMI